MDSNRLRAVTGRSRPLTRREAALRSAAAEQLYGTVDSPALALSGNTLDYTDLIASPSLWSEGPQLSAIAKAVGLHPHEADAFLQDPDDFLQLPLPNATEFVWIEHPLMALELDRAWENYVHRTVRSAVCTAAIVLVFAGSRLAGQSKSSQATPSVLIEGRTG